LFAKAQVSGGILPPADRFPGPVGILPPAAFLRKQKLLSFVKTGMGGMGRGALVATLVKLKTQFCRGGQQPLENNASSCFQHTPNKSRLTAH
jgi:hypothetical protein